MACPNYTDYKDAYFTAMHCSTIFCFPFNCLGVYCIIFKSPVEMKPYCWYLHTHQIFANGLDFLLTAIVIPIYTFHPAFSGYPDGVLTWLNVPALPQSYPVYCWAGGVQAATVVVFLYRHQIVLPFGHPRKLPRSLAFYAPIIIFVFCLWWGITIYLTIPDQNHLREEIQRIAVLYECVPENFLYPATITTILGKEPILYAMALFLVFWTVFPVLVMIYDVFNVLQSLQSHMSQKTRRTQAKFMKALILQCCIPVGLLLIPFLSVAVTIFLEYHNPSYLSFAERQEIQQADPGAGPIGPNGGRPHQNGLWPGWNDPE